MQSKTYRAEISGSSCEINTQSMDNATCASGLEITFESLPQTIDIRLIPDEDGVVAQVAGGQENDNVSIASEGILNKSRQ